jgi:hypothetical protein
MENKGLRRNAGGGAVGLSIEGVASVPMASDPGRPGKRRFVRDRNRQARSPISFRINRARRANSLELADPVRTAYAIRRLQGSRSNTFLLVHGVDDVACSANAALLLGYD